MCVHTKFAPSVDHVGKGDSKVNTSLWTKGLIKFQLLNRFVLSQYTLRERGGGEGESGSSLLHIDEAMNDIKSLIILNSYITIIIYYITSNIPIIFVVSN